jgi:hypothetical protein
MCRRYAAGENSTEIAAATGFDRSTVHYWLCRRGVSRRSNSEVKRRYRLREDAFAALGDEAAAYWLGFLFADGSITIRRGNHEKAVRLLLQSADLEHLEAFAAFIGTNAPIRQASIAGSGAVAVTAYSSRMVDDLIRHGCVPNKSAAIVVKIPPMMSGLHRHFIRGVWDGDGSAFITDGTPNLNLCGNAGMLDTIREIILWHTGVDGTLRPHTVSSAVEYLVYRGKTRANPVGRWLYSNAAIALTRKQRIVAAFPAPKRHYAGTVGAVSESVIRRYIANQKGA